MDPKIELLLSRRSVRRFTPQPVGGELVQILLEAAVQAPSAHNRQPWRFAVLQQEASKQRLAQRMGAEFYRALLGDNLPVAEAEAQVQRSRQRILQAPLVIVLCLDLSEGDPYPDRQRHQAEYLMGVQGVAMAGENLLLAAHALGLGGVWVCAPLFAPQAVQAALDLPETWQPQGMILLGYPQATPAPRPRRPLEEVVRYD